MVLDDDICTSIDPKKFEPQRKPNYILYYTKDPHVGKITGEMIENYEDGYYNDNFDCDKKDDYKGHHEYLDLQSMTLDEYKEKYMKLRCVQWSSDLNSWWCDCKDFKHQGCCTGTYLMKDIDTQDPFKITKKIDQLQPSVKVSFKKDKKLHLPIAKN